MTSQQDKRKEFQQRVLTAISDIWSSDDEEWNDVPEDSGCPIDQIPKEYRPTCYPDSGPVPKVLLLNYIVTYLSNKKRPLTANYIAAALGLDAEPIKKILEEKKEWFYRMAIGNEYDFNDYAYLDPELREILDNPKLPQQDHFDEWEHSSELLEPLDPLL